MAKAKLALMKLYILQPIEPGGPWDGNPYDKAYGFVVQAYSIPNARKLAAEQHGDEGSEAWLDNKLTSCKELKTIGFKEKIIMRDFNAG